MTQPFTRIELSVLLECVMFRFNNLDVRARAVEFTGIDTEYASYLRESATEVAAVGKRVAAAINAMRDPDEDPITFIGQVEMLRDAESNPT